jgi:hypothetical protein
MINLYRLYLTTLSGPRQFLGDMIMLIELWEKVQHFFQAAFHTNRTAARRFFTPFSGHSVKPFYYRIAPLIHRFCG